MGFRVESYSLDELNRIAVPGKVAPSLFWVLPIGGWTRRDLDRWWELFVRGDGPCSRFGLLLVREYGSNDFGTSTVDFHAASASLRDLLPPGSARAIPDGALQEGPPRLFFISGSYPQPGWGVLVEWEADPRLFDTLIGGVLAECSGEDANVLRLAQVEAASAAFIAWREVASQLPARPGPGDWPGSLEANHSVTLLRRAVQSMCDGQYREGLEQAAEASRELCRREWKSLSNFHAAVEAALGTKKLLECAESVLAVDPDVVGRELISEVDALLSDPGSREAAYKRLPSQAHKRALSACLYLRKAGVVSADADTREWAKSASKDMSETIVERLREVIEGIRESVALAEGERDRVRSEYVQAKTDVETRWRELRRAISLSAQAQWDLGPSFLARFERALMSRGIEVQSIPWDPARMVGWKLLACGVTLDVEDLRVAAKEATGRIGADESGRKTLAEPVDGGYFTDYVHHIAVAEPERTARQITGDLLARLLRPTEMKEVLTWWGVRSEDSASRETLAEALLTRLGWARLRDHREIPLAAILDQAGPEEGMQNGGIAGNDLRIAVESLCKDILDLIVTESPWEHKDIWRVLSDNAPNYRPMSASRDWAEEVENLTVGGGAILIRTLGDSSLPEQATVFSDMAKTLQSLGVLLNAASHHRQHPVDADAPSRDAVPLARELLDQAIACFGELPWHLRPTVVYGDQPRVISGEGWNHGCATPRLLRVLEWSGRQLPHTVVFWNRTRRNPVITDPVLLRRPR